MRGHPRRVDEGAAGLPTERIRTRISAYVYGNILVLAAVATSTPHMIETGLAALAVAGTTATTYVAHVFAHLVAEQVRPDVEHGAESARQLLRDATPIMSSGALPTGVLLVAALVGTHQTGPWALAAGVVTLGRLAGIGLLVGHLNSQQTSTRAYWFGAVIAAVGLVIVVLKVWLAH